MLTNYLALDVGEARIGVALANSVARIASPIKTLNHDDTVWNELEKIVAENQVQQIVVGWPRGLEGQETDQTRYVANFIAALEQKIGVAVLTQDEAVTSITAEAELKKSGKPYEKGDIDSLSAVYILEDFLQEGVH
jgi:putative Holliday junction resolvase